MMMVQMLVSITGAVMRMFSMTDTFYMIMSAMMIGMIFDDSLGAVRFIK